ncbi:MAG: DUF6159 family protein [Thermoplasmata archaeon]
MGRIGRGWQMSKISFGILRQDKELVLFPFLALLVSGVAWGLLLASIFFLEIPFFNQFAGNPLLFFGLLLLFYFLTAFVAVYFQAAVVGSAMIRLEGGHPTVGDAFRQANKHLGKLFLWALLTATIGLILRAIRRQAGLIGGLIAGALGVAWALATSMAVPVIVAEGLGPWAALKRSASLFRRAWGETLVGGFGIGLVLVLLGLLGLLPLLIGFLLGTGTTLLVGGAVALAYWFGLILVWGAAWPAFSAVLYQYAAEGRQVPGLPEDVLAPVVQA